MGFPKTYASTILSNVFKKDNKLALLASLGDNPTKCSGTGYQDYTIKDGDFKTQNGVTTTARHILFGLAEEGGWGTCAGIAVYSGSTLLYWGELAEHKPIGENTVPVFKMYNEEDGEGLRVTLDVVTAAAVDVVESS